MPSQDLPARHDADVFKNYQHFENASTEFGQIRTVQLTDAD
jgi:hypothetical protein